MYLSELIAQLHALEDMGSGHLPVLYRHMASGDCGNISSVRVTDEQDDQGPFDVEGEYVVISIGS